MISHNRPLPLKPISAKHSLALLAAGVLILLTSACNKPAKQFINLDGQRPDGYTHIVTTPPGRTIYVSGMGGKGPDGILPEDFRSQTDNTFKKIGAALRAANADFKDIVKINYFVTDLKNTAVLREVRAKYLNMDQPPAATLVQVGLGGSALLEIECIAVVPE